MTSETDAEIIQHVRRMDTPTDADPRRRYTQAQLEMAIRIARRGAEMQWRPISEAPGQTMRVLLFSPGKYHADWNGADYGITVAFYAEGEWRAQGTNHDVFEYDQPTHWMPLPPPPKGAEE